MLSCVRKLTFRFWVGRVLAFVFLGVLSHCILPSAISYSLTQPSLLPSFSLLSILRGDPDPIHSSLYNTASPLSAMTLRCLCSARSVFSSHAHVYSRPRFMPFSPSSPSFVSLQPIARGEWLTSVWGSCMEDFLIGGEGDEKDKASWTCPDCAAKNDLLPLFLCSV